jgi:hypothetical protein
LLSSAIVQRSDSVGEVRKKAVADAWISPNRIPERVRGHSRHNGVCDRDDLCWARSAGDCCELSEIFAFVNVAHVETLVDGLRTIPETSLFVGAYRGRRLCESTGYSVEALSSRGL